jgi:Domain of unknown function (DUF397)
LEQPAAVSPGWRTSSYSNNGGDTCVEVGTASTGVLIRDTTDRTGTTLAIPAAAWRTLLIELRA